MHNRYKRRSEERLRATFPAMTSRKLPAVCFSNSASRKTPAACSTPSVLPRRSRAASSDLATSACRIVTIVVHSTFCRSESEPCNGLDALVSSNDSSETPSAIAHLAKSSPSPPSPPAITSLSRLLNDSTAGTHCLAMKQDLYC